MIRQESRLNVADNSGAKEVLCIRVLGGNRRKYASIGDLIVVSVKKAVPRANVKKKEIALGVIVRARKEKQREDGSYIRFSDNAVVLVNKDKEPRGTRVLGPIAREVRNKGYHKLASLAKEVY